MRIFLLDARWPPLFFGRSLPFLILFIILKNEKNLYVGSFNFFSNTIWNYQQGVTSPASNDNSRHTLYCQRSLTKAHCAVKTETNTNNTNLKREEYKLKTRDNNGDFHLYRDAGTAYKRLTCGCDSTSNCTGCFDFDINSSIRTAKTLRNAQPKNYLNKLHDDTSDTFQHVVRCNTKDIHTN